MITIEQIKLKDRIKALFEGSSWSYSDSIFKEHKVCIATGNKINVKSIVFMISEFEIEIVFNDGKNENRINMDIEDLKTISFKMYFEINGVRFL